MPGKSTTQATVDPIHAALEHLAKWSSSLPIWQQDALRRLYSAGKLSDTDFSELSRLCREPYKLLEITESPVQPQPVQVSHFPSTSGPSTPITLKSIGHTQHVNALADGQALNFAESGLNIVYGDNGSGKSGYGRILKRACRARDQEEIVGNVYSPAPPGTASARIQFSIGGVAQAPVVWQDHAPAPDELSAISVFDSKCASIHVDGHNELAYTPAPLQLLQSLAHASRQVGDALRENKEMLERQLAAFRQRPASHVGTAVHTLVTDLSANAKMAEVRKLSELIPPDQERLQHLKRDLASDPVKQLRHCKALRQRLEALAASLKAAEGILSTVTQEELARRLKDAKDKDAAAKFAAAQAFKDEPLPMVGSQVWKALWEAARKFSSEEAYSSAGFPNTGSGAVCVLCQQPLSANAADRLTRFEMFVRQNAQRAAVQARQDVENFKKGIREAAVSTETLCEAVNLLRDELDRDAVCREVVRYLARGRVRARRLAAINDPVMLALDAVPNTASASLATVMEAANRRIAALETSNPEQRKILENELHGLLDRAWLATILADVETEITRLKKVAAFDAAIRDTDTGRITRKATEISKTLVTDTMRDAFAAEVADLGLADRRIELTQDQSGYGSTRFRVSLVRSPEASVGSVLSEGEHRCIALAAFLAELSTANSRSTVVFEDPVSSLDHNYRETVAARLVSEAANGRQVVIFTHDIAFLMMLDDHARQKGVSPHYQTINRSADNAGICGTGTPAKAQPAPELLQRLEHRLNSKQGLYTAGQIDEWWDEVKLMAGRLRDTWEIAAEHVVSPVIRRFSNKVQTGGLRKLTVLTDHDCQDLKVGYGFCCEYCHTDAAAVNRPPPTPAMMRDEIKRLRDWFSSVQARQKAKS
jgi:energy-coupling factor transporter ATP-binding protein EcfA2